MVSRTVVLSYFTLATFLASVQKGWTQDEAPSFLKEPSSQIVKRNSRVRLKCEFLPKDAQVVWKFNGKSLGNTSEDEDIEFRHSQLIIKSFRSKGEDSHAGEYRCFVNTSIGLIVSRTAKLRVAYIKKMSFNPPVQTSIYLGGTGVIKCIPPDSKPQAIIQFKFNGQYIEESSDRHRVLPSGYLQIHNVTEDDVGLYTCSAYNTVSEKRQTAKSATQLTIKQDYDQARSIIYAAGASVFIGESAVLSCVSEDSYVRWFRKDSKDEMPDKADQQWGNLYIENVRKHDMGVYTCKSYSDDGNFNMAKNVVLEVKIRPAIRSPPKDTSVDPGKMLSLKCSVVGEEDEIEWLFNTLPIDPLDTDYIADGRQLKIRELAVKHLGMYQCYVENELGSAQSSAQVKFSRGFVLPSFKEEPTNMTAIENEEIFFLCSITGQPTPFTYWLNPRNDFVNTNSRFYVDGEPQTGGLTIADVRPQDTGWYTCVVKNTVGEVSAKAYLEVLETIVVPPSVQHTIIPTIQPIEGAVSDEAQTATINNEQQPVKNGAVPNQPSKATVSEVTSSSVDVTWIYEDDLHAPASEFYIQKLTILRNTEWTNTTGSIPSNKRVYRIVDLIPGTIYRFRVFAANRFGSSQSGEMSHRFLVGGDDINLTLRPIQKPKITLCEAESTTSIIVAWEYESELETQPVDGFYIYHRADTDDDGYESNLIQDMGTKRYVIKNLENDMLYDIKMQTFNVAGLSGFSNVMSTSTDSVKALASDFMKPDYKAPATPKSPIDVPEPEKTRDTADKEEILYICIGVILGTFVIIFFMFAGMCIWRSRQPNGMFGAINWSQGYYGRAPPQSKGSQDFNNRYMNGCPVYDQQYQGHNGGPYGAPNGRMEPRALYMMPQDTEMPIDVSQYLSAEQNEMNQNGSTMLGSQHGTLERRHPSFVRPVKREDLKLTPNGIVCRPTHPYSSNGDVHHQYNSDIQSPSSRDIRYYSNGDVCCQPTNNEVNKHVTRKASHNSLAHESIAEDDQTQSTPIITQQRRMRNSEGDTSNEDTALSRSRSSSANSSQSTHSIVESDV